MNSHGNCIISKKEKDKKKKGKKRVGEKERHTEKGRKETANDFQSHSVDNKQDELEFRIVVYIYVFSLQFL